MIVVIIAGGSGTRLWPLSTPSYPKHLLTINGGNRSLLQGTYDRARKLTAADKIYVVSDSSHIEHVKQQLPDLAEAAFLTEPARRGTASCVIGAIASIEKLHDADEPIAFLSADHYIRDWNGFAHSFRVAAKVASSEKRIVLVGVEPDYPATGFGYIQKGELLNEASLVYNVDSFKEKPNFNVAKKYVQTGDYLWNCGYFVGSVNTFKSKMEQRASDLFAGYQKLAAASTEDYAAAYLELENNTIDYALIEKVEDLLVVPASFDWMDLGSFGDLAKAVGANEDGNYMHGVVELEDVNSSFVHNEDDKPVVLIGLDNVVVINTPHGILVARKDMSQKVGAVSKRINATIKDKQ